MIAGPTVNICNYCVEIISLRLFSLKAGGGSLRPQTKRVRCSFCGKNATEVKSLFFNEPGDVRICNECYDICVEILLDDVKDKKES
jgi:hypothetical protein